MTGLAVLVVGAGRMGHEHAAAAHAAGDTVGWVVDADSQAATALADRYGAVADTDLDRVLDHANPDAVVIASPSDQHLAQARRCVGTPILLEKPPWLAGQDPAGLLAATADRSAYVAVGMTTRFDPAIAAVRGAVAEGRLGQVLSIDDTINFRLADDGLPAWYHLGHDRGGGIIQTNGVHALDRICWMLGEVPRLIAAKAGSTERKRPIEDQASITLATATAVSTVSLLWSRYEPPASRLDVTGTRGTATAFADGSWEITTADGTERGPAAPDRNNYLTQWLAFRAGLTNPAGRSAMPTIEDLRGPMTLLKQAIDIVDHQPQQQF